EAFGIHEAGAPVDDPDEFIAVAQMARCVLGRLVANRVEDNGHFADALGYGALNAIELELVALPFEALAVGGLDGQPPDILHGSVRTVRSRHPLRVPDLE